MIALAPSLHLSPLIREYHLQLLQSLHPKSEDEKIEIWPPERVAEEIYENLRPCFWKVTALLEQDFYQRWGVEQKIDCDRLDPVGRHLFFVCTTPFEHPSRGFVPGLSGLEQLMGYVYLDAPSDDGQVQDHKSSTPTTGSLELDALVDTLLIFKGRGHQLARFLSRDECIKACIQASARMQPDQQNQEVEETEPWKDHPDFLERKSEILAALQEIGVNPPADF